VDVSLCDRLLVGIGTDQGTLAQAIQPPLYDRMGNISTLGLSMIVRLKNSESEVGAYAGSLVRGLVKARKAEG
jgi:hypothetical protein